MKIGILVLLFSASTFAQDMRVMTFNTTCSVCNKGQFDKFKKRKYWIVDTIERTKPDLIGMQEVLTHWQLNWFRKKLKDYRLIYHRKFFIFRYADPALFIRKERFAVEKWGGFWLGPLKGWFSLGWKIGLPRRIQWSRLMDRYTGKKFYFVSSHFDNSKKNKTPSAKVFVNAFDDLKHPVILAADTNLRPHMEGYKHINKTYHDSYDIADKVVFLKNSDTNPDDSCNLEKGKIFPDCRVDHIFLSKDANWDVKLWGVDQYKYGEKNRFTSDHRAYFADITL
jgi:endonuclease/exonuclease/phosphatase family metal-dependent hydrolase